MGDVILKEKILTLCLGISFTIILLLSINIIVRQPVCNRMHLDDIDKKRDVVTDKRMALEISELYLREREDYMNQEVRTNYHNVEDKYKYDVEVTFNEQDYEWMVAYRVIQPGGSIFVLDGEIAVRIRRDNGMVNPSSR